MTRQLSRRAVIIWQGLFLVTSMSWLLAPAVNHILSYQLTLISQYETSGQPYAWLFRGGDVLAGVLLLAYTAKYATDRRDRWTRWLLLIVGGGMVLDPILTTTCIVGNQACTEPVTVHSILHGLETMVTAGAFFAVSLRDVWRRRRLPSVVVVGLQAAFGIVFYIHLSYATRYDTLFQYLYQCGGLLWLAWFCRDRYFSEPVPARSLSSRISAVRWLVGVWAGIGGMFAIISSLSAINLLGHADSLYFAGRTAWLAQHGVIIGVIMLYLSRHIIRGEQRARQLLLAVLALEALRYALITPYIPFLGVYFVTFSLLFLASADFQRGAAALTWQLRLRDLGYLLGGLLITSGVAWIVLDRNDRIAHVTSRAFGHFGDYVFTHTPVQTRHIESVLLAHTISTFAAMSIAAVLWILFKPSRTATVAGGSPAAAAQLLARYSSSSEDYFKLWPADKQYFWDSQRAGFIAYKIVGPVAFALADPVGPVAELPRIVAEFIAWARSKRLRACFLAVFEPNLSLYRGLSTIQIGASALIDVQEFMGQTVHDKWWRWKQNRAAKQGYTYVKSLPPHNTGLLADIAAVSADWLQRGGHEERGFALGAFSEQYMRASTIHYLRDQSGTVAAFVNQLPACRKLPTTTIDLLRYRPSAQDAMPFLLQGVIEDAAAAGYHTFDLGFVPFAASKGQLTRIAAILSAGRFSAKGLEQFKNKFNPQWQPNYLAYDGDLGDLALIALNLERAMQPAVNPVPGTDNPPVLPYHQ